jgi:uroporphyrinogen-III synthase
MLSLTGKRILVTRTRQQSSDLAARLEALGAIPILIPTIEIVPPESYTALDNALEQLDTFDWILFTSANAIEVFAQRRVPGLAPKRLAVIGPATAKAAQAIGLQVDLIPPRYVAESLADALSPQVAGCRVLLIRAVEARDVLPESLTQAGAFVTVAPAYGNQIPATSVSMIKEVFDSPKHYPDAIPLTSASTARSLVALLNASNLTLPQGVALASIGPITSEAIRDLGYEPAIEATEATVPALIEALEKYFAHEIYV